MEVSFNVLTRSGGVKRIGSMGVKSMADQRTGRSRVGSKCCGVGRVRRKTTRHGTAKLTHGQAPCRFSALFASGVSPPCPFVNPSLKERPLNGLSKVSRLNRCPSPPADPTGSAAYAALRVTLQLGTRPLGRQNRLAISSYDSIFLESKETIGTLSIGQVETSVVAGVGLTPGSRSLPPRYGIYGSKHSTRRKASDPAETIAGSDH